MGILSRLNQKEKVRQKEELADRQKEITEFTEKIKQLQEEYACELVPVIERYGLGLEIKVYKKKSKIITPDSGLIVPK